MAILAYSSTLQARHNILFLWSKDQTILRTLVMEGGFSVCVWFQEDEVAVMNYCGSDSFMRSTWLSLLLPFPLKGLYISIDISNFSSEQTIP
jgi:hypothetical protein